MSKYTFTFPEYHAIHEATIENDGITVIAGENGSGKSTLSRMMYSMVNLMSGFENYVFSEACENVLDVARRLAAAMEQISRTLQFRNLVRDKLNLLVKSTSLQELKANHESMLHDLQPSLLAFFQSQDTKRKERILDFLGVSTDGSPSELTTSCLNQQRQLVDKIISKASSDIDTKPRALLQEYIQTFGLDLHDFPKTGVKFLENGVDLLVSKFFSSPLSLKRAFYIDTPMAVNDNYNLSSFHWNRLTNLMTLNEVVGTEAERFIRFELEKIMNGNIQVVQDKFTGNSRLHFKRSDGLDIELVNAATGIKSFAIISRLLTNGLLKNDTLLLIDEPEAHLHPQWVVEYANILVKLNKALGVKIIIASHNPDMVSAIRAISETEGVLGTTRFYLAEKSDKDPLRYKYQDLGTDIAPIFESFNIALSRIDLYGAGSNI